MVFTTVQFIAFFAAVFFAYYAIPQRYRWWLLLGASWFFYAFATPYYLIFLGLTTIVTYLAAIGMDNNLCRQKAWIAENGKAVDREEKKTYKAHMAHQRRLIVTGVVLILIGMLVAFKYLEFMFANVTWLCGVLGVGVTMPEAHWILPLGLSFYVFQSLGYCIDVEREMVPAERNFFKHALFVSYFPQILQGPIGDYGRLAPQLFGEHKFEYERTVFGLQRVAWGFFKKVMIANVIADRINPVWHNVGDYPGLICWMAILFLYSIQLYADFSGYMDIACGCSQMLGVRLDENFDCPYFSRTIAEFWRKWHITLGAWFKNYVFYPLLRSDTFTNLRKRFKGNDYLSTTCPTLIALLIVWLLIGLWHGADWSYVLYGLFHGAFVMLAIALGPIYDKVYDKFPKIVGSRCYVLFQMARTFLIVMIGYSIFKPADLSVTAQIWKQFALPFPAGFIAQLHQVRFFLPNIILIGVALIFIVDLVHFRHGFGVIRVRVRKFSRTVRWLIYLLGLWVTVFYGLYGSGFDQFEYFKF